MGIVFLAIEVRHARTIVELQTIEDVTNGWIGLNESVVSDPQFARVLIVGHYNPGALTDVEAVQYSMWWRMYLNQVGRVEKHFQLGLVSQSDYESALHQLAQTFETPGGQLFYETEPGAEENWRERLEQFWGGPPDWELMLGRDKSAVE